MRRSTTFITTLWLAWLQAQWAHADARLSVHDFYGPNARQMQRAVVSVLGHQRGVTIVPQRDIDAASRKLGVDPATPNGRTALAQELKLSAWLLGVVEKRSDELTLSVAVLDASADALVGRAALQGHSARMLLNAIHEQFWPRAQHAILPPAAAALQDASVMVVDPDVEPPAEGSASSPDTAAAANASASRQLRARSTMTPLASAAMDDTLSPASSIVLSTAHPAPRGETLRAFLGVGSPHRNFAFTEPLSAGLGDHTLSGAPMADINLAVHPARPYTTRWPSYLGLDLRAQLAANASIGDRAGNVFTASYAAYHLGVRSRVPVGAHFLSAFIGYAMSRAAISHATESLVPPTPSVDYRMVRAGLGAEYAAMDSLLLGIDASWLAIMSAGEIARWFPHATAGGFDFAFFGTYAVTQHIFARATAAYQRLFFDFNSRSGDRAIAGGATDEYLAISLGAGIAL